MTTVVKGKLLEQDIAKWDGITRTAARKDQTGGTIVGNSVGHEVDVLEVYGSGSSYTWQTITDCINRIGSTSVTLLFKPGSWTVDQNLTIGSNFTCRVPAGCVFNVSSGKTLTFNGPVIRDSQTWASGSGTVVENGTRYISGKLDLTGAVIQGTSALVFEGSSDDGFETTFSITNPTADRTITFPDADVNLGSIAGTVGDNTWTGNNTFTSDLTIQSSDAGAAVGPNVIIDRNSVSQADGDVLGAVVYKGRDDGGGTDTYAQIQAEAVDSGAGSEDGKVAIQTAVAGTLATRAYVAQGIVVGAATGGDQGVGTINATELYKNGSAIPTPGLVGPLATKTASSSASISFNSSDGISSTYNEYWVQLEHVVTAGSGDAILVRLDTNDGASFDAGATDYVYRSVGFDSGANDQASGSTGGTSIRITGGTSGVNSTANNGGCNSWVKFKNVNTTAGRKQVRFETDYFTSTNVIATLTGTGSTNSTTLRDAAVNAFQFLPSSANPIASGEFRLFGVKKS